MAEDNSAIFKIDSALINEIEIIRACDEGSRELAKGLRYSGYEGAFGSPDDTWDELDGAVDTNVLIALAKNRDAVGTVRVTSSLSGCLEIDKFTTGYRSFYHPATAFLEASRLVVPKNSSIHGRTIQAALWKAVHRYAYAYHFHQLIAWVKTGPDRAYKYLLFDKLDGLSFRHPSIGNTVHEVYALDITRSEEKFRSHKHPLWEFFFVDRHENLIWY